MSSSRVNFSSRAKLISFFASLCLFLSALEYAIPKPLPFMRVGIANLPILLSLTIFRKREILLLTFLKVLGQALITGTLFSYIFLFSAAGSFASTFAMIFVFSVFGNVHKTFIKNRAHISFLGISLAGSLANNAAQLALSFALIFGANTRYIAPVLLTLGFFTGASLGVFAELVSKKSAWFISVGDVSPSLQSEALPLPPLLGASPLKPRLQFFIALFLFPFFLLNELWLPARFSLAQKSIILWFCAFVFFVLACIKKKRVVKILPSFFMTAGITFFQLFSPEGKTLFHLGAFRLTLDAIFLGLHKSAILCGMVFLSQFAVDSRIHLPGKIGNFLYTMFYVFEKLSETRLVLKPSKLIETLDARLFEITGELK